MRTQREFPHSRSSVAAARAFAREVLPALPTEVLEPVVLMVSELATNALIHASDAFVVTIDESKSLVQVSVTDSSPVEPVERSPSSSQPHGRGLQIVKKLADEWGSAGIAGDGKDVWFRIYLRQAANVS